MAYRIKPVSFYIKLFFITSVLAVLGLIIIQAAVLAYRVSVPLRSKLCCETPARFGAGYEAISFVTADGLDLHGWYIPPRNGAVIILLHSYYGDRRQTLPVAEMIYKNGYGALMYDQRASGESEGNVRSLGWRDIPDVSSAVEWLARRDPGLRIGAYGCSMGGAIALAGTAANPGILALAVDAPSALQWYENLPRFSLRDPFSLPIMTLYYPMVMLRSWALPPESTSEAVQRIGTRPVLFISTGRGGEYSRTETYFELAQGPKEHWNIPGSSHCAGPLDYPAEYQHHLVDFYNSTLR